jgi:signal transduction histidine kinase
MGVAAHNVHLNADLRQSREQLVAAREEERRRLRRDLHDGLGPQLASQTLTLTAARQLLRADPAAADALLAQAVGHAQDAITDIRRVVYGLRPPALDDLGLASALREQVERYQSSGVAFTLTAPGQLPPLPAAVEVAAYYIAHEGLTNVVRHARAQHCRLNLCLEPNGSSAPAALIVEIADDGVGLPPDVRTGVGLASMRERAEEVGGILTLATAPGGTTVRARLPMGG